jgi:class 3 adenylate cyclase
MVTAESELFELGAREAKVTSIGLVAEAVLDLGGTQPGDAGTVTIVFSDIEGSTVRAVELGDLRWHEVLSVHNQIMRRMLVRHHGVETHSLGDGFMMCFRSARSALAFVIDAQRALAAYAAANPLAGLSVRAGVHTGEAVLGDDGDLFGRHVVMASRIADQARGGEILVSSLVREIVEPRGDIVFGESRTTLLKGLQGEHLLHRIVYLEWPSHCRTPVVMIPPILPRWSSGCSARSRSSASPAPSRWAVRSNGACSPR